VFFGQQRDDAIGLTELLGAQNDRFISIEGALCAHGAKGS
jgi:hypothetical protein